MKKSKIVIALIAEAFKFHKNEDVLLVTTDNVIFLKSAENLAKDHTIRNGGKVEVIKRDEKIEVLEVVEDLKAIPVVEFEDMTIKQINEYATENGIVLVETKKANLIVELELALTGTEEE